MAFAICAMPAAAKDNKAEIPLNQWLTEHRDNAPKTENGMTMYYPLQTGGEVTISANLAVAQDNAEDLLTAILMGILDNEEINIISVEPTNHSIIIEVKSARGTGKDAATYMYTMNVECKKGTLDAIAHTISINYKEKGLIPRTLKVEKFNPSGNERHAALIDGLTAEASGIIATLAESGAKGSKEKVTHWNSILAGEVTEGMNETEVTLAKGKPFSTSKSGGKTKWRYEDNSVVIFTNGVVTRVI